MTAPTTQSPSRSLFRIDRLRDYGVVLIVVCLVVLLSFYANNFLTVRNFMNIADQNAHLFLVALGATLVIISGAFDLSAGQVLSVVVVVAAQWSYELSNPILGLLLALLLAVPIGMINGFIISRFQINSFLATLATGLILSGFALFAAGDQLLDLSQNRTFTWLGTTRLGGVVPLSLIVSILVFAVLSFMLAWTKTGRHVFAVGANPEAARLSGVSIIRIRVFVYAVASTCAAIGALIYTSRTGVGRVVANADSLTLSAIAAVVIGGTSISGGRGALWRTVVGVLLLALLQNAFNMLGIAPYWQTIVSGLVILLAVLANASANREA